MITTSLQGGLANQVIAMSSIWALARDNGAEAAFNLDTCYTPLQGYPSSKYKETVFKNAPVFESYPFTKVYHEVPGHYEFPLPFSDDTIYNGYFQSELYFKKYKEELRDLFSFQPLYFTSDYITLHVRRGDYLNNPDIHCPCSLDYYSQAIEIIGGKSPIFIFSDDTEWCRSNFKGSRFHVEDRDEVTTLKLMMGASHSIIANSTFSWVGAWFRKKPGKTVAPKNWFGPNGPKNHKILCDDWIKI